MQNEASMLKCCYPDEIFLDKNIIKDLICPIDLNIPFVDNIVTDLHGHSKLNIIKVYVKFVLNHGWM